MATKKTKKRPTTQKKQVFIQKDLSEHKMFSSQKSDIKRFLHWPWGFHSLSTLGPIGYFPKGSGTVGSVVALPFAYLLYHTSYSLFATVILLLGIVGIFSIQRQTAHSKEKDPSCVIIDEVVGQMIPFLVLAPNFMHWQMMLAGFILFRIFDIFKFGPVAFWDRRKNAFGVMMDDVAAGINAGFCLAVLQVILIEFFNI